MSSIPLEFYVYNKTTVHQKPIKFTNKTGKLVSVRSLATRKQMFSVPFAALRWENSFHVSKIRRIVIKLVFRVCRHREIASEFLICSGTRQQLRAVLYSQSISLLIYSINCRSSDLLLSIKRTLRHEIVSQFIEKLKLCPFVVRVFVLARHHQLICLPFLAKRSLQSEKLFFLLRLASFVATTKKGEKWPSEITLMT